MQQKRVLLGLFLLLVAGSLGWQIGIQMERQRFEKEREAFEAQFGTTGSGATFAQDPEKEVNMTLFWTVWKMLDRHYVDPKALEVDELRFGAVRGLVEGLKDPYSAFMTPKESSDFQESLQGKLEGIGAELTLRDGFIVVVAPLKGSPAQKAELLPLDVITEVDGNSTDGFSLSEAVQVIRGPKGSEVILTIFRPSTSETLELIMTRDEIHVPSVEHEVLKTGSGTVGYIALNQFGDETTREAREALMTLTKGAIDVASFFLKEGKIVSVHRRGEEVETHFAFGDPILPEIPMVVLINEGSASASEIVAGALQDLGRAKVLGVQSFGKGTVQEVVDLPGGSSLRITVATWHTPNGKDLSKQGVTPDFIVPLEMKAYTAGLDAQKDKAAEYLLDGNL